jgi:hypothetical protein
MRALAMETGLYDATDPDLSYAVDCTIEMFDSILKAGGSYRFAQTPEAKQEKEEAFIVQLKNFLEFHETRMLAKSWNHVAGNYLTAADFVMAAIYFTYTHDRQPIVDSCREVF